MAMTPEERQARLIGRRQAKIVWNKSALDAMYAGMADGLIEIGERIIADARDTAPRDPEAARVRGVPMMADTGFISVWGQGKLVHGSAQVAASKNKPRGVRTPKDQVVLVAAFASPIAHFNELGTVKMVAHPFLLPAFNRGVPGAEKVLVPAVGKRVRAVR
jgi:hypothetical protein